MTQSNSTEKNDRTLPEFPWKALFVALAIFIVSAFYLGRVYANLCLAFIFAYLLDPIVNYLVSKKFSRDIAALLVLVVFFLSITLFFVLMTPKLIGQCRELLTKLPAAYQGIYLYASEWSQRTLGYNAFSDFSSFIGSFGSLSTDVFKPIGGIAQSVLASALKFVTTILGLLIIPLLSFYLLREFPHIYKKTVHRALPQKYHRVADELRRRLNQVLGGFLRGQLVVSTILAVYYSVALSVVGVHLSLVLGILSGFLNIIPYLGILSMFMLSLLITAIHAASLGKLIAILIIYLAGMVLEGSVLTPKVLGERVGLSPLTLIIALLVGGELFGVLGMILAVPVAAVIKVLLEMYLDHRFKLVG